MFSINIVDIYNNVFLCVCFKLPLYDHQVDGPILHIYIYRSSDFFNEIVECYVMYC